MRSNFIRIPGCRSLCPERAVFTLAFRVGGAFVHGCIPLPRSGLEDARLVVYQHNSQRKTNRSHQVRGIPLQVLDAGCVQQTSPSIQYWIKIRTITHLINYQRLKGSHV